MDYCIHACGNGEAALAGSGVLHAVPSLPVPGPDAFLLAGATGLLGSQRCVASHRGFAMWTNIPRDGNY